MKKKILFTSILIITFIIFVLTILPLFKIKKDNKIKYISYSDDISRYETNFCYDESYTYYEDWDISINNITAEKVFIFYIITLEYKEGNVCDYEYYLEESYIDNFLENATILYNNKNIDLAQLIEGKEAIVSNTRYFGNDYDTMIEYKLNGREETMYIFYKDDLLVIQVGHSDEGPKFIAYR